MARRVGLFSKIRGNGLALDSPNIIHKEGGNHQPADDTECTASLSDENEEHLMSDHSADASGPKAEDSIETAFVELQHELREKAEQCDILRETLSTMSVKMKRQEMQLQEKDQESDKKSDLLDEKLVLCERQEMQLQEKDQELDKKSSLLKEKLAECAEWKLKYEKLCQEQLLEKVEEKVETAEMGTNTEPPSETAEMGTNTEPPPTVDSLLGGEETTSVTTTEIPVPVPVPISAEIDLARLSPVDPLLGDLGEMRANRPWSRKSSKASASSAGNNLEEADNNDDDDDDEDSIAEPYRGGPVDLDELDEVCRPKRAKRKSRKSKKNRGELAPFKSMPMEWVELKQVKAVQEEVKEEAKAEEATTSSDRNVEELDVFLAAAIVEASQDEEVSFEGEDEEETPVADEAENAEEKLAGPTALMQGVPATQLPNVSESDETGDDDNDDDDGDDEDDDEAADEVANGLLECLRRPHMSEIVLDSHVDSDISLFSEDEEVGVSDADETNSKYSKLSSNASELSRVALPPRKTTVKEMKQRRARIRRMARREARRTGFGVEKIEC